MSNSPWSDFPAAGSASQNPYAPTEFTTNLPMGSVSDVETRNKFLNHEASIQGIGALYLLGSIFLLIGGAFLVIGGLASTAAGQPDALLGLIVGLVYLPLGLLQFWVGRGLRAINPKVRTASIVLSVIGLIGFPIGTIISAYFLYLLASKKGEFVFSAEYARVRAATPEIKYRTSWIVWGFLIALILLIVLGILAAVLGA
ncbi:MAG TPA: hypothetical protein DDZ51_04495 [Planctomycetaceae bacterium]|nr:hypothetical protein [Planctomycetaceae bacterium]